jgi:hypothetical protein
VKQDGHTKILFSFRFDSRNRWTVRDKYVKFGVRVDRKHTYTLYMKYSVCVSIVLNYDDTELQGYVGFATFFFFAGFFLSLCFNPEAVCSSQMFTDLCQIIQCYKSEDHTFV